MRFLNKKILLLLLQLQILTIIVALQYFIPIVLGPDFQHAYSGKDILCGFKLNVAEGGGHLKGRIFNGDISPSPFLTSFTPVITNVDDSNYIRAGVELCIRPTKPKGHTIGNCCTIYLVNGLDTVPIILLCCSRDNMACCCLLHGRTS
mmetsp:Transcript_11450/g.17402  ORF Transcript_11450/g.17402 Transcript_11450/m.17402 type:complete len:148 (-) Transcript_11450:274-717(-)